MRWSVHGEDAAAWRRLLEQFPERSVYQAYGWGEYKRNSGWGVHRLVAAEGDLPVAAAQVLVRHFPLGSAIAWVPGAFIGRLTAWEGGFRSMVTKVASCRHLYCRLNGLEENSREKEAILRTQGWNRPVSPLLSGQSTVMDVLSESETWLKSIRPKHRYYVRKSEEAGIEWSWGNTDVLRQDFALLTARLSEEKGMRLQERDAASLADLDRALPETACILVGSIAGEPVTGCMVLIDGEHAFYASAATVGRGREVSAAYCMIARLRQILRERGVTRLDLGGISPDAVDSRGVDHFKLGFGGRTLTYLGEWDWADNRIFRMAADRLIGLRAGSMR